MGQSVAGKLVAKYLKFNCTHFKSINSHLFPIKIKPVQKYAFYNPLFLNWLYLNRQYHRARGTQNQDARQTTAPPLVWVAILHRTKPTALARVLEKPTAQPLRASHHSETFVQKNDDREDASAAGGIRGRFGRYSAHDELTFKQTHYGSCAFGLRAGNEWSTIQETKSLPLPAKMAAAVSLPALRARHLLPYPHYPHQPCQPIRCRLFVLAGTYLFRFKNENSSSLKGAPIPCESITLEIVTDPDGSNDGHVFTISTLRKTYTVRSETVAERAEW